MIKVLATLTLFQGPTKREVPFSSGYRPLFKMEDGENTSGQITLLDREKFKPGETGVVEIKFLFPEFLGKDFRIGKKFQFREGKEILGEGDVLEILQWE